MMMLMLMMMIMIILCIHLGIRNLPVIQYVYLTKITELASIGKVTSQSQLLPSHKSK